MAKKRGTLKPAASYTLDPDLPFGPQLKAVRIAIKMRLCEVSRRMYGDDVDRSANISGWENHKRQFDVPGAGSFTQAVKYARALGIEKLIIEL